MPCDYAIRGDIEVVVARFWGSVEDDEFVGFYRSLLGDVRYRPGLMELTDLRSVDMFSISRVAIQQVDRMMRRRLGSEATRMLIIAPAHLWYGLARVHTAFAEPGPEQVEVFRTVQEAAESASFPPAVLENVLDEPFRPGSAGGHARDTGSL
jgi:hypothetical protein